MEVQGATSPRSHITNYVIILHPHREGERDSRRKKKKNCKIKIYLSRLLMIYTLCTWFFLKKNNRSPTSPRSRSLSISKKLCWEIRDVNVGGIYSLNWKFEVWVLIFCFFFFFFLQRDDLYRCKYLIEDNHFHLNMSYARENDTIPAYLVYDLSFD